MSDVATERWNSIMAQIEEIPDHTPERCEVLAFTFMTLARAQWRKADRLRQAERDRERRSESARKRDQRVHREGCGLRRNHRGDCRTTPEENR